MPATATPAVATREACPKRMTYGPCGGVRPDGECEIGGLSCPFVPDDVPDWAGSTPDPAAGRAPNPSARRLRAALARGNAVVADLPARTLDRESLRACVAALGDADAVLLGDTPRHRVQFPPAYRAALVQAAGATPWVGLNARDRNRVALEGELAALAELEVGAVHCVTGDHPASGDRPDASAVFDLDSTRLAALASGRGLIVSVAESPAAPPRTRRPARLLTKQHGGAEVCIVNFCGGPDAVSAFAGAVRALCGTTALLACVAVVCDAGSAAQLAAFRESGVDPGLSERILAAPDPRRAGIEAAVQAGLRLLDTGVLAGVNLSGGPADGEELAYAEALAEVAEALR